MEKRKSKNSKPKKINQCTHEYQPEIIIIYEILCLHTCKIIPIILSLKKQFKKKFKSRQSVDGALEIKKKLFNNKKSQ